MTANLPMYMRPELRDAHDTFWSLIQPRLVACNIHAPLQLSHPSDLMASWLDESLTLSQTCGMPYRTSLHGKVQLAGTPDYRIDGCQPGYYCSAIVVRQSEANREPGDFEQSTLAYNSENSQSGYAAAFSYFKPLGFWFEKRIATHGHQASALAVAEGKADIAAIDAVTWRLMQEHESFTDKLTVLDWTEPTPGLPYITALKNDRQNIFESVSSAIAELPEPSKTLLGIYGLVPIKADDYLQYSYLDKLLTNHHAQHGTRHRHHES